MPKLSPMVSCKICVSGVMGDLNLKRKWSKFEHHQPANKPSVGIHLPSGKPQILGKVPDLSLPTPTPVQSLSFPRICASATPSFCLFVCLFLKGIICTLTLEAYLLFLLPEPFSSSSALLPESLPSPPESVRCILCASPALHGSLWDPSRTPPPPNSTQT